MTSSNLLSVQVTAMRLEAKGIVSIELGKPDQDNLPSFEAGSHIDLHLANGLVRSYSLLSSPQNQTHYIVAVLNDRDSSGGSRFIHEKLRVGDLIAISAPRNNFSVDFSAEHSVLIAGGIGVTPIMCMLNDLRAKKKQVEVLYCARSRSEAAFVDMLSQYPEVQFHFDDEQSAPPDLKSYLDKRPKDSHVYCCGPTKMLDAFENLCEALHMPNVHVEHFAAAEDMQSVQNDEYVVTLSQSNKTISVPAGKSLLDAILDAGVNIDHSCREGICGACETKVLEGIPDHRDNVLTKSERAANKTIMVCVSGCICKKLILDV